MFANSLILVLVALLVCIKAQSESDFPSVVSSSLKQDLLSKVQLGKATLLFIINVF
jgi:hypothetical protein